MKEIAIIKVPKIEEKITNILLQITEKNREFLGFQKESEDDQRNICSLFEQLITWRIIKYNEIDRRLLGKGFEEKLLYYLQPTDHLYQEDVEWDEYGWYCRECGNIHSEHPFVHIYLNHFRKDNLESSENFKFSSTTIDQSQ